MRSRGLTPRLEIAGGGDIEPWRARAASLGVADAVAFLGRLPHAEVRARMASADVVIVPSRRNYPEGLPNTLYEALAARAAVVLSDHPAFVGRLRDREAALFFPSGDCTALAERIAEVAADPALAGRLRAAAPAAHAALYVGMEWPRLICAFLNDPCDATGWVGRNALTALGR